MSNTNPAAVIVFRHAKDLPTQDQETALEKHNAESPDKWKESRYYIQEAKSYPLPDPAQGTITIPWQRLAPDGFMQATDISTALSSFISKHWAPVSQIITKNPKTTDQTQNPFQTVMPFTSFVQASKDPAINPNKNLEVSLGDNHSSKLAFDPKTLLSDNLSTVICWDRQGLWPKDGDKPTKYILETLANDKQWPGKFTKPEKAATFFVFTNPDADGKYDVSQYNYDTANGFVKHA